MLGEDFELEYEDGTLWIEAESAEEVWQLFSESAPPVVALASKLERRAARGVPSGLRRALRGLPGRRGRDPGAAAVPDRARQTQVTAGSEVADLLQRLIRLDTTNPPGNESIAAELLRDYLEAAGVDCTLYAREPGRANLVARIPGRGDGPSLAFLSHTDVVLADPAEWSARPLRRRARRRRGLGPRCARHEGRGRGDRRRGRDARARRLARVRRSDLRRSGRRRGRRRLRAAVADRGASGCRACGLLRQRGRGRPRRARRQGALSLLDRGEDELAVPAPACTAEAGTRRCRGSPTTRSSRPRRSSSGSAPSRPSRS